MEQDILQILEFNEIRRMLAQLCPSSLSKAKVVTKGVANVPWEGNPTPRIAETYGGMLNAVGLQNPGYDLFAKRDILTLGRDL